MLLLRNYSVVKTAFQKLPNKKADVYSIQSELYTKDYITPPNTKDELNQVNFFLNFFVVFFTLIRHYWVRHSFRNNPTKLYLGQFGHQICINIPLKKTNQAVFTHIFTSYYAYAWREYISTLLEFLLQIFAIAKFSKFRKKVPVFLFFQNFVSPSEPLEAKLLSKRKKTHQQFHKSIFKINSFKITSK